MFELAPPNQDEGVDAVCGRSPDGVDSNPVKGDTDQQRAVGLKKRIEAYRALRKKTLKDDLVWSTYKVCDSEVVGVYGLNSEALRWTCHRQDVWLDPKSGKVLAAAYGVATVTPKYLGKKTTLAKLAEANGKAKETARERANEIVTRKVKRWR